MQPVAGLWVPEHHTVALLGIHLFQAAGFALASLVQLTLRILQEEQEKLNLNSQHVQASKSPALLVAARACIHGNSYLDGVRRNRNFRDDQCFFSACGDGLVSGTVAARVGACKRSCSSSGCSGRSQPQTHQQTARQYRRRCSSTHPQDLHVLQHGL